jgi:hypothetical protein
MNTVLPPGDVPTIRKKTLLKNIKNLSRSTKPFLLVTKDAIIVSVVTIIIIIILMLIYYFATSQLDRFKTMDFWQNIGKSFAIAVTMAYISEYGGLNNALAEGSIRYARGSALSKFKSRRHAYINEIAYVEAFNSLKSGKNLDIIEKNREKLSAVIDATRETPLIIQLKEENMSNADILKTINKKKEYIDAEQLELMLHLVDSDTPEQNIDRLKAISRLVEILGNYPALTKYIINNGFECVTSTKTKLGMYTLDMEYLQKKTGINIKNSSTINNLQGLSSMGMIH